VTDPLPSRRDRNSSLMHFSMLQSLSLHMWLPPVVSGILLRLPVSLQSLTIEASEARKEEAAISADR